ncbi:MAG: AMP-binding protein [Desulfobacteraceae bacterium]|nr:AMP-binding protein [Desulfobacteraceae bacterium]
MKVSSFIEQLEDIAAGPAVPGHPYILSGYTYAAVYAMAGHLQHRHFSAENPETVCLCATDRAVVAAALLAALTRPVTLVIPYSFSAEVLDRTHRAHGFSKAIADEPVPLPSGVETILPDSKPGGQSILAPAGIRNPDSVFVKLFTGGSTRAPRTWSKTIDNLFGEAIYHARKLSVTPDDRFAATVPAYHIYGLLFSVLTPLAAGASIIDGEPTYPREIQKAVSRDRASILVSIPLHYKMLAGTEFTAEGLRCALSSAARLEAADSRAFYRQTELGITEVFGSTETGGIATRLCTHDQPHFTPFDCIEWKIKDHLLAIRSDFISPELPVDENGFFITSDRVKAVGPNGFALAGRADRIVKVGGKRVDLEEVRSAITGMQDVTDAAVICTENGGTRGNEIRAIVAASISSSEIRRHLRQRIPDYAVPRHIRIVDQIPVSPAGKYDSTEIRKLLNQ